MTKRDILIVGRLWRDSYGNTYHSRRLWIDGEPCPEAATNYAYGYGDHYAEEAINAAIDAGRLPTRYTYTNGAIEPMHTYAERVGLDILRDTVEVLRKRDLHNAGRK